MRGYDADYEIWDELDDAAWDEILSGSPGGSIGPGTAGARWCACGSSVSWPAGTAREDREVLQRIQDEHEASCPAMTGQASPRVEEHRAALHVDPVFEIARSLLTTRPADLVADYLRECHRIGLVDDPATPGPREAVPA